MAPVTRRSLTFPSDDPLQVLADPSALQELTAPWPGRDAVILPHPFAAASLTLARVPISLSLAAGRRLTAREPLLPGRISLNFAISRMCSDVKMILPLPQQAWGKRPLLAPSRSHDSVQRMRAAASAGSKNSMSMGTSIRKKVVSSFMPAKGLANMTGSHPPKHRHRRKAVTERSVASAPAWRASGIKCP
jgi:hypothetical protein